MNRAQASAAIRRLMRQHVAMQGVDPLRLLPSGVVDGKLYEAYVLSLIARDLQQQEGLRLQLEVGPKLLLRASHGPIDLRYSYLRAFRGTVPFAEVFTDIEFTTLSWQLRGSPAPARSQDYHELDIVIVRPGAAGRPSNDEVLVAVECKATAYGKNLFREILGVRRELGGLLLSSAGPIQVATHFGVWPAPYVCCAPASCLLAYSTDAAILRYADAGATHSISLFHEPV